MLAVEALAAGGTPVEDDVIAGLDVGHARADGIDHARAFMPADDGQRVARRAGDEMIIAVADAAGGELDAHFARARLGEVERFDGEGGVRLAQQRRLNLHEIVCSLCRGSSEIVTAKAVVKHLTTENTEGTEKNRGKEGAAG